MPSASETFPSTPSPSSSAVIAIMNGISTRTVERATASGTMTDANPRIIRIFRILLPTTLPICDTGISLERRGDADCRLRRTGSHRNNRQSDNQLRNAEPPRDAARTLDKPIRALYQHPKSQREQTNLQYHTHVYSSLSSVQPSRILTKKKRDRAANFVAAKSR